MNVLYASALVTTFLGAAPPEPPDSSSVTRLTAELRPVVRAVIAAMLREGREHPDVEDATHETLRRAIENREKLADPTSVRPWVVGIARHVALDVIRDRKRRRDREAPGAPDEDAPSPVDRLVDQGTLADDRFEAQARAARVRTALARLPVGQREALELFHMEGLKYDEIGARMGVPLGTVATWVARGRKTLAETLADERIR